MVFKSGVRYRLTGSVTFFLDASSQARISITPHGTLDLNYALAVNDKLIELGKAAAGTVWVFDGPANSTSTDAAAPGASATSAAASSATGSVASPSLAGESQRFEVEFDHDSFDVLVNRRIVVCEAEFLEEDEGDGSAYTVPLSDEAGTARIVVLADGRGGSKASLTYNGTTIARLEDSEDAKTGAADAELMAKGVKAT